jgi:adenylate cyclase
MPQLKDIRFKIKLTLPSAFFGLILIVAGSLITLNQINYSGSMKSLSAKVMREISTEVESELMLLKKLSHYQLEQTSILISEHLFSARNDSSGEVDSFSPLLVHSLRTNPSITQIYFASFDGNFTLIRNGEAGFSRFMKHKNGSSTVGEYDSLGYLVKSAASSEYENYNALDRFWYKSAIEHSKKNSQIFESDVYKLFRTGEMGLTYSTPVYKNSAVVGVIGLDISMASLTEFMSKLPINDGGSIFLINKKGVGVVHTEKDAFSPEMGLIIHKPTEAVMSMAPKNLSYDGETFHVRTKTGSYLAQLRKFPTGATLGVIFPMKTILGDVYKSNFELIQFSILGVLIASIAGMIISSRVTRPLAELQKQTEEIRGFNLNTSKRIESRFVEIDQIGESFQLMQKGLASFKKFVPADLVRQIMSSGSEAALGGEDREMSIMFMDIADFTTLSEKLSSDELVKFISEFFQEMSLIILENKGTVDKYIGDCIMSFWNAPKTVENHEQLACKTALACLNRLDELQLEWKDRGLPTIKVRIGLHSDTVTVGNMGSKERLNYTVIGDGVNLASRLEGLGKVYGVPFIISENISKILSDSFFVRPLDCVVVKGKTAPVPIFTIKNEECKTVASLHTEGYDHYKNQNWNESEICFKKIVEIDKNDRPAKLFLERISLLKENPPGEEWDGVFHNLQK